MKILVLNAGSSSHKCCLYGIEGSLPRHPPTPLWEAQLDWHDQDHASLRVTTKRETLEKDLSSVSRFDALSTLLTTLWYGSTPVVPSPEAIDVVGHRVVHGGQDYQSSVVVAPEVKAGISSLIPLAPNHNPANLEGIELIEQLLGNVLQVAVFDTAFHSHIPEVAAIYPGPYNWQQQGIRRYGFHGISHQYCTHRAAELLSREVDHLIICHLGNGASMTAVQKGQSINTSMGFTPLEGLMMGTRSGSIDPGILIHLMRQGYDADQLDHILNQDSGLKGISGVSHDLREIEQAIAQGNVQAKLARDLYLHRLKSCLGSMLMSLGGVDAVVFTGGIGEHSASVRAEICEALAFLGLKLDPVLNQNSPVDQDIAAVDSKVRVVVIKTQEDWAIAQSCYEHCG